jgi:adenosylhomocysteine nucleosidase
MSRVAIIAAMEREVTPLIGGWKVRGIERGGRRYRLFEKDDVVLICGGIGAEAARRATEAVIQEAQPVLVISAGFAGALDSTLRVGDVFEPRVIVNAADGARTDTGSGQGTMVSYGAVADPEQKRRLAKAYAAVAVDMEAAAVAQGAQSRGVEFAALKAISDAADFLMPPTERFVSGGGQFRSGRFALHVVVRPWLWGRTVALARNSARASRALCDAMIHYLESERTNPGGREGQAPSARVS